MYPFSILEGLKWPRGELSALRRVTTSPTNEVDLMRGRPLGTFRNPWNDPDWPYVVLLDAQVHSAPLRGVRVSERMAALFVASAAKHEFQVLGPAVYTTAPPCELAPTGRRNSPRTKVLANGYDELILVHSRSPSRTGDILEAMADRLRKKRKGWLARKESREWLRAASAGLACRLYPALFPDPS